ncbi:MAG: hypothetical protein ACWGOX_04535, partial [Desulforhopalus sp.]
MSINLTILLDYFFLVLYIIGQGSLSFTYDNWKDAGYGGKGDGIAFRLSCRKKMYWFETKVYTLGAVSPLSQITAPLLV